MASLCNLTPRLGDQHPFLPTGRNQHTRNIIISPFSGPLNFLSHRIPLSLSTGIHSATSPANYCEISYTGIVVTTIRLKRCSNCLMIMHRLHCYLMMHSQKYFFKHSIATSRHTGCKFGRQNLVYIQLYIAFTN